MDGVIFEIFTVREGRAGVWYGGMRWKDGRLGFRSMLDFYESVYVKAMAAI